MTTVIDRIWIDIVGSTNINREDLSKLRKILEEELKPSKSVSELIESDRKFFNEQGLPPSGRKDTEKLIPVTVINSILDKYEKLFVSKEELKEEATDEKIVECKHKLTRHGSEYMYECKLCGQRFDMKMNKI